MDEADEHENREERGYRGIKRSSNQTKRSKRIIGATHGNFPNITSEKPIGATPGYFLTGAAQEGMEGGKEVRDDSVDGGTEMRVDEDEQKTKECSNRGRGRLACKWGEERGQGQKSTGQPNKKIERPSGATHGNFPKITSERPIGETPGSSSAGAAQEGMERG